MGEVLRATREASPIHASENWERDAGNGGAFLRAGGRPRRHSSHDQQLKPRAMISLF